MCACPTGHTHPLTHMGRRPATTRRYPPQQAVDSLRRADPVLARITSAYPDFEPRAWLADLPSLGGFQALLFQVVGGASSHASWSASGASRRPHPSSWTLTQRGCAGQGSRNARSRPCALAARFADGAPSDSELAVLSDAEIIEARLTTIAGIGPWTVHGFLIVALDRPDVVLPGDLALREAIQTGYDLDHLPSEAEVIDIAEPWRPYRSLATACLCRSVVDRGAVLGAGAPVADSADDPPGGAPLGCAMCSGDWRVAWSHGNWEDARAGGPLPRAEGGQRWLQS